MPPPLEGAPCGVRGLRALRALPVVFSPCTLVRPESLFRNTGHKSH